MLDLALVREQFPSLRSGAIHLDNPGGTQIARQSLERIQHYYQYTNANHGGLFRTSYESDAVVAEARRALADWLNASRPEEIVFGPNMTTLTLHMSRSLAHLLQPGDEIVLTHLDHDANVAPWLLIAKERDCSIHWVDFHQEDCTLDLDALEATISPRTKIVAIGYASNAVGTINDVRRAAHIAHRVGALCYVDAVQYVAHGVVDVQALDCDFLACSAYKYFGPHWGVLYGKYELLDRLMAYKVRTSSDEPPEKWETGTPSFEAIAGTLGALDYFGWVGKTFGGSMESASRRQTLVAGMETVRAYEQELSQQLISQLQSVPGLHIWGITDPNRLDQRVSTVSFTIDNRDPADIAKALGDKGIYVWNGNFYALEVTTTLGLESRGGLVRVGAVHYNTHEEINQLIEALCQIVEA